MTEKLMNFLPKQVPNIIAGTKTWTRRLKKEGEHEWFRFTQTNSEPVSNEGIIEVCREDNTVKFKVDEVRQVAVKGKPVWYCPKCNSKVKEEHLSDINRHYYCRCETNGLTKHLHFTEQFDKVCAPKLPPTCKEKIDFGWLPLKIKILSIKPEERLVSITNADAVAEVGEGLKYPRKVFFQEFIECYRECKSIPNPISYGRVFPLSVFEKVAKDWNPLEWPIEFKVVK